MPWLDRSSSLLWHFEQSASFPLPLVHGLLIDSASTCLRVRRVLRSFDIQRLLGQGLDNLKGQEAEDINDVVVRFAVDDGPKARPLSESFALPECKAGLSTVGPVDVFLSGHVFGTLVSRRQARKGRFILFLFLLVFFVVSLGNLLCVI